MDELASPTSEDLKAIEGSRALGEPESGYTFEPSRHGLSSELRGIVGIGASAGGLEALRAMFELMPTDSGLAFIVTKHLSPDFPSFLNELLRRYTVMDVQTIVDGQEIEPNTIYINPARHIVQLRYGRLYVEEPHSDQSAFLIIDPLFRSLAAELGEHAMAVILSGAGSDGADGAVHVHRAGGLVIAQAPETAKFDTMPRAAQVSEAVSFLARPEDIPRLICNYVEGIAPVGCTDGLPNRFDAILDQLNRVYSLDFGQYKVGTVGRRIIRRIRLVQANSVDAYTSYLNENPEELDVLYRDLLIGVTRFFRDPDTFAYLESEIIPTLIRQRDPERPIRIWCPACATGEEAYSLAILLEEQIGHTKERDAFKIFATDMHPGSLQKATTGFYETETLEGMSPERIERHFVPHETGYRVRAHIRTRVFFSKHNVLVDAPFTKMDLVSCRNMMIYLKPKNQKRVLSRFHFSLRPDGILFLGDTENTRSFPLAFDPISEPYRVYRRRKDVPVVPDDLQIAPVRSHRGTSIAAASSPSTSRSLIEQVHAHFVQPAVLVDQSRSVVHTFGGVGAWLTHQDGRSTGSVLDVLPKSCHTLVSSALFLALEKGQSSQPPQLQMTVHGENGPKTAQLAVEPIHDGKDLYALIRVHPLTDQANPDPSATEDDLEDSLAEPQRLRDELAHTREYLQSTIEEMEVANEELQSANEELQSTNEEIQSVNEELYTVNTEHQLKITELTELMNDMENLLASTDLGLIFVDHEFCIRKFTPRASAIFGLIATDQGRKISLFSQHLQDFDLAEMVAQVHTTGEIVEQEVRDHNGTWFLVRILPYLVDNLVEGVLITLVDVGRVKRIENQLDLHQKRFASLAETDDTTIYWTRGQDGQITTEQPSWQRYTGQTPEQYFGLGWINAVHPDERDIARSRLVSLANRSPTFTEFSSRLWNCARSEYRYVHVNLIAIHTTSGVFVEWVGRAVDIHEQRKSELQLIEDASRTQAILNSTVDVVVTIDQKGIIQSINKAVENVFGYQPAELIGINVKELMPEPYRSRNDDDIRNYIRTGVRKILGTVRQVEAVHKDGTVFPIDLAVSEVEGSEPQLFTGVIRDLSERYRAQENLAQANTKLSKHMEEWNAIYGNVSDATVIFDAESGRVTQLNSAALRIFGLSSDDTEALSLDQLKAGLSYRTRDGLSIPESERPIHRLLQGEHLRNEVMRIGDLEHDREYIVRCNGCPVRTDEGKIRLAVLTMHDITSEVRYSDALLRSERRFRMLADLTSQIVWSAQADGTWDFLNAAWTTLTGRTREQSTGTSISWADAVHPEDRDGCLQAWNASLSQAIPFEVRARIRTIGGSYHAMMIRGEPDRDPRAGILHWYGTMAPAPTA